MHHRNIHHLLLGIGALAVCAAAVPAHAGLIHHWPMDGDVNDVVGGKTGTVHGSSSFVPGVNGNAFYCDGSTYITTNYTPQLGPNDSMSIAAWVKVPTGGLNAHRYMCGLERSDHQQIQILYNNNDGNLYVSYRDDDWHNDHAGAPGSLINDGQWHHLAGIRDKGTNQVILYVDGVPYTSNGSGGAINQSSPLTMDIGANHHNSGGHINPWLGAIDDLRFYDHPLSQQEIDDLVANDNGPDHYWPLDSDVNDVVGGSTGTVQGGGAAFVPGIRGNAFEFDGNRYITTNYTPELGATDSMTISTWIKIPASGTDVRDIVGLERSDHQEIRLSVRYDTGTVRASFRDDDHVQITASAPIALVADDSWHHVVGVRDAGSGEVFLYIDGRRADCEIDLSNNINFAESRTMDIGADNNSSFGHIFQFTGLIDEVRFYDRALSYNEIWDLYNEDICPGDLDGDGDVDQADLGILLSFYNNCN